MRNLPKEFAFLQKRKESLQKELFQIESLEQALIETRVLLDRAMNCVGRMTNEEFVNSPGGKYMRLFLDGKLEEAARKAAQP